MNKCFDGGNCGEGGYCDKCPLSQQESSGNSDLLCCPCGQTPKNLCIMEGSTFKWRRISGDCCGEWEIETRVTTIGKNANSEHHLKECIEAWNSAPRAT